MNIFAVCGILKPLKKNDFSRESTPGGEIRKALRVGRIIFNEKISWQITKLKKLKV